VSPKTKTKKKKLIQIFRKTKHRTQCHTVLAQVQGGPVVSLHAIKRHFADGTTWNVSYLHLHLYHYHHTHTHTVYYLLGNPTPPTGPRCVSIFTLCTKEVATGCWWLMPIILAAQEAEIRLHGLKPAQTNSSLDPISKKPSKKWGWTSLATPLTTGVGEDAGGKRNPLTLLVGM
jgi:hypothetical protein